MNIKRIAIFVIRFKIKISKNDIKIINKDIKSFDIIKGYNVKFDRIKDITKTLTIF